MLNLISLRPPKPLRSPGNTASGGRLQMVQSIVNQHVPLPLPVFGNRKWRKGVEFFYYQSIRDLSVKGLFPREFRELIPLISSRVKHLSLGGNVLTKSIDLPQTFDRFIELQSLMIHGFTFTPSTLIQKLKSLDSLRDLHLWSINPAKDDFILTLEKSGLGKRLEKLSFHWGLKQLSTISKLKSFSKLRTLMLTDLPKKYFDPVLSIVHAMPAVWQLTLDNPRDNKGKLLSKNEVGKICQSFANKTTAHRFDRTIKTAEGFFVIYFKNQRESGK